MSLRTQTLTQKGEQRSWPETEGQTDGHLVASCALDTPSKPIYFYQAAILMDGGQVARLVNQKKSIPPQSDVDVR